MQFLTGPKLGDELSGRAMTIPTWEGSCASISVDDALLAALTLAHRPDAGTRHHYRWRLNDELSRRGLVWPLDPRLHQQELGEAVPGLSTSIATRAPERGPCDPHCLQSLQGINKWNGTGGSRQQLSLLSYQNLK